MGENGRKLVAMKPLERARAFLAPILAETSCGDDEDDAELVQCLADAFAESDRQAKDMLVSAMTVIGSFRPLAVAAKAIVDDGWPALASNARLPASLEARLVTLREAYEGIADMVSDADAEAGMSSTTT